jgi:hypothetical protein
MLGATALCKDARLSRRDDGYESWRATVTDRGERREQHGLAVNRQRSAQAGDRRCHHDDRGAWLNAGPGLPASDDRSADQVMSAQDRPPLGAEQLAGTRILARKRHRTAVGALHDCGDADGRQHRQSVPEAVRDRQLIAGHRAIASDVPRRKLVFDVQVRGGSRNDRLGGTARRRRRLLGTPGREDPRVE